MFGNRMNYTQSPGGKRRGLIYQSSGERIDYVRNSRIYIGRYYNARSGMNEVAFEFEPNGDITFNVYQSRYSLVNFPINDYILNDKWYPIEMIPIYTLTIGSNVIDLSTLPNILDNVDSDILIKKETVTITTDIDNTQIVQDYLVVYYDITNVSIYRNDFYDITNDHADRKYKLRGYKQRIPILTETVFNIESDFKYFTYDYDHWQYTEYPQGSGGYSYYGIDFNQLNTGHGIIKSKIYYKPLSVQFSDRYTPYYKIEEIRITGNDPIEFRNIGGYPNGYTHGFMFSPVTFDCPCEFHWYDIAQHQTLPTVTYNEAVFESGPSPSSPSGWVYNGVYYNGEAPRVTIKEYRTPLFRTNPNMPTGHIYANISKEWGLLFNYYNDFTANSFDETVTPTNP